MTQAGTIKHDPIPIGEVAKPPFARSPDPLAMFARRAARLRVLANGHELHAYLKFLADLCDVQHRLQPGLPDAELPPADAIGHSRQFRMPPLDRIRFERDGAMDAVWERLLAMAEQVAMPDKARIALSRLRVVDPVVETTLIGAVLANEIPPRRWLSTCSWPQHCRCTSPGLRRTSMPKRWCRSVKALVPPVALLRCPLWWSVGVERTRPAFASARCAGRSGIIRASNARCAARPRILPIKRLPADPLPSKPKRADPAAVTSR